MGIRKASRTQSKLIRKTQPAFGLNLLKVMQVGRFDENGAPRKVTQAHLSEVSGISRSSIAKFLSQKESSNPDLETICRLASALNVSPAMLLMTSEDWMRLAHAVNTVSQSLADETASQMIHNVRNALGRGQQERARLVLELARLFGYGTVKTAETEGAVRTLLGILGTCALPAHPDFNEGAFMSLLPLCMVMGARNIDER